MRIFEITAERVPLVAGFLTRINPVWFNYEETLKALNAPGIIGWYMGENADTPIGSLCIKLLKCYECVELENWGYDDDGAFHLGEKLAPLFTEAERYAKESGYRYIRTTLSWERGEPVTDYVQELAKITSYAKVLTKDEGAFGYLTSIGFRPAGFMPDCYHVENAHGVMIVKHLYS